MHLISHRGNLAGPKPLLENTPDYICEAIGAGFDVEIDVWADGGAAYLGHDKPGCMVDWEFILSRQGRLWCHAKNLGAMHALADNRIQCYFWHQKDDFTLTSNSYIWTFPGMPLSSKSICVMPEYTSNKVIIPECAGICSDYIADYKDIMGRK